jgi:hypothetical protein
MTKKLSDYIDDGMLDADTAFYERLALWIIAIASVAFVWGIFYSVKMFFFV